MTRDAELDGLREAVDAADVALMDAMARRLAAVRAIGEWKRHHGVGAVDRAREDALRARWVERAAGAGVPAGMARAVLGALLDGCRAEVERVVGAGGEVERRTVPPGGRPPSEPPPGAETLNPSERPRSL